MPASQQPLPIHLHIQPHQTAPTVPLPYAPNSISSTTIIIDSAPAADPSILPVAHTDPVTSVIVPDPVHNDKPAIVSASSSSHSKKSQSTTPRVPARPEPAPTDTELERLRKVNRARAQKPIEWRHHALSKSSTSSYIHASCFVRWAACILDCPASASP